MDRVSLFGPTGFIGSHYLKMYPFETIPVRRDIISPPTNQILWTISTVHNYHVFDDLLIDIHTNQILLMEMLEKAKLLYGNDFTVNFLSSWFVYGSGSPDSISEDYPCNPKGFYSITKLAAERMLASFCETFGVKYRIFRLANVIGVGDRKVSKKKNAIQYMVEELAIGNTIQLYNEPSHRNVIDVRDCVEIIHSLINNSPTNEIYNVGTPASIDVNALIGYAQEMCGTGKIGMVDVPEFHKKVQDRYFYMDTSKISQYIPFDKFHTLAETLHWIITEKRKLNENS